MNVSEAVDTRLTVRGFLPRAVDGGTVREIFTQAARAPSGGNLQPWRVYVLGGVRRQEFVDMIRARLKTHPMGEGSEYDIYPRELGEPYRTHRYRVGEAMYETLGIPRQDKAGRRRQFARNFEFFGAPVAAFFAIDRCMQEGQWADLGMFMQNVMLLARERGLHTCPQEAWALWPRTVSEFLHLPDELMLFCGMGIGYADPDNPINTLRSERAPLKDFTTFSGI